MDTNRHQGKTAIVTGAGSGIGQATLLRLTAEGATVTGCDISTEGLELTREALVSQGLTAELLVANGSSKILEAVQLSPFPLKPLSVRVLPAWLMQSPKMLSWVWSNTLPTFTVLKESDPMLCSRVR